ncbi:helix-turn-helix domain-containing protein [Lysinibacillus sp. 54212]|uniref:helix-turn-helix domain-containing protein n=1 Tax=Lysinibacillus sp. 54212 TaxID=3119829 RepID=UPI002FC6A701
MTFHQRLREFRKNELNISLTEAAYRLNLKPNTYSNYENGERPLPFNTVLELKEKFAISDETFLNMLFDRPRERRRLTAEQMALQTQEIWERYSTNYGEAYYDFISSTPEIRELISQLAMLDSKKQKRCLNAIRTIVSLQADLLTKIEKLENGDGEED